MEGFVYKWTNTFNGKWYIGSHKGTPEDGYTASGTIIQEAFSKYGMKSFSREVIYQGKDFRELEEFILVTLDAKSDPISYNLKNEAIGGGSHLAGKPKSPEHIENLKGPKSPKHVESMKKASNKGRFKKGATPWNKGTNPDTTSTKERRARGEFIPMEERVRKANKTKKEKGYTNGKLGTSQSEETKRKIAESVKRSWLKRKSK